jgi:hypothetical protein
VALYRGDGTRLWIRPLALVQEARWLGDGSLLLVGATGIARVDPATGNMLAADCGWSFGRTAQPHPPVVAVEPLCVQVQR